MISAQLSPPSNSAFLWAIIAKRQLFQDYFLNPANAV